MPLKVVHDSGEETYITNPAGWNVNLLFHEIKLNSFTLYMVSWNMMILNDDLKYIENRIYLYFLKVMIDIAIDKFW